MTKPRHEPLAHLALASQTGDNMTNAAVVLQALPYHPSLLLRGEGDDQALLGGFLNALGFDLPIAPFCITTQGQLSASWLGPNEWLIIGDIATEQLAENLAGCHHALIDIGDGQQIISVSGTHALDALTKHCPLDFRNLNKFQPWCSRTVLAGVQVTLRNLGYGSYHVHVSRSISDYTWRVLEDAALEFGVTTVAGQ